MITPCDEGRRILDQVWKLAAPMKYAPPLPNAAKLLLLSGCPVDDCLRQVGGGR